MQRHEMQRQDENRLVPPSVASLRGHTGGVAMERTLSEGIRKERDELKAAAEQTLNVIVDLNLDGTVRWVSPSWVHVIGTQPETVESMPIADLIVSNNKTVFTDTIESMRKDDSRSHFIRFAVNLGFLSKLLPPEGVTEQQQQQLPETQESSPEYEPVRYELEAQGIMVYDRATGNESHTMWMIRPWIAPREIKIDLPPLIVETLGSGAEVLASYLTQLAEIGNEDPANHPPPLPVLCRICERQIPPWWFEKHTELCIQEHRAEMDVQMAQENLNDHRHAIVKVLDTLEARKSRPLPGEPVTLPLAEYKGLSIGPTSSTSSPGTASPVNSSKDRSSGLGHARSRSFAIRRPQARIVELLLDLCDTAIEISPPAIKESTSQGSGELQTQSPQSESRISQVLQWQSPGSNTLEQEQGLALLCADTENLARGKVDAVHRYRRILEYSERIRIEFAVIVQDCIDEAIHKAARIAAGRLSDSTESEEDQVDEEEIGDLVEAGEAGEEGEEMTPAADDDTLFASPYDAPSSLVKALRNVELGDVGDRRGPASIVGSTRSNSPRECSTPRSMRGGLSSTGFARESRRESMILESDTGESEGSVRSSSVASRHPPRTDSPISDFSGIRRATSSRQKQRRSLIIPGTSSPNRQESPNRGTQPSSPLRIMKPRNLHLSQENITSPEPSPMLSHTEFHSPASNLHHHHHHHHRRQSSVAISEFPNRHPPSPRLNAVNPPPMARAVPPSIKDFEIIKPISKGAFGSVYLSKKKTTGEYFAIKVLKKADMVAKNQVTNVKAERAIMMWQGESDFVAKLYWTFSSKDYLYLVMEYLNGGDCASLIKILGGLPEDWVKKYLGEVILGVEHLHSRGIIHRDLKPDNLLIDQKGHLKLTDFGLSRMGLIGRQKRALTSSEQTPDLLKSGPFARSASMASSRSTSMDLHGSHGSPGATPQMTPSDVAPGFGQPSYFSLTSMHSDPRQMSAKRSDSGGSETLTHMMSNFSLNDHIAAHHARSHSSMKSPDFHSDIDSNPSPDLPLLHQTVSHTSETHRSTPPQSNMMPPPMALFDPEDTNRRFVGTPDYLAPETIRGERQDETSDWWSVGCIMFEFLYGIPPFHASEPELVFENILARKVVWPEDTECEVSPEAKDLINKLLCMDPQDRFGSNRQEKYASGGEEIRSHPWFEGVNWETLLEAEAQFVPHLENPEDTEYFDSRGATLQAFTEEMEDQASSPSGATPDYPERPHDALSRARSQAQVSQVKRGLMPLHIPPHIRDLKSRRLSEPVASDDFGPFAFKNLTVLEKANKDVIQQLKAQAMASQNRSGTTPGSITNPSSPSPALEGSPVIANPVQRTLSNAKASARPASPSPNHANSSPSRASQPSSPLLVSFVAGQSAEGRRKPSNSSNLSQSSSSSLQPGNYADVPKVATANLPKSATSATPSPIKGRGAPPPLALSPSKQFGTPRQPSSSSSRSRSLTVGSQEGSPIATDILAHHRNRRSQVFDMSPSSSDNEGEKANALLRVQRRRQSSRRLSAIHLESPSFRSLDVLICEDHPVSRMVMEKLLEKLRCRTISATTGSEAVRYAMSEIKFDIIFTEFKLPEVTGTDIARMVRELKNINAQTPIVAITSYLKELQAPHYFDSLIEKPISQSKLIEVLSNMCHWKPASPHKYPSLSSIDAVTAIPSGLRLQSVRVGDSPTSGSSGYTHNLGSSSFQGSSREDSISSSLFGDTDSTATDDVPATLNRKGAGDTWDELGVLNQDEILLHPGKSPIQLISQQSAPAQMEAPKLPAPRRSLEKLQVKRENLEKRRGEGSESADDEDEELGGKRDRTIRGKSILPSSKLGIEMMRANSHDMHEPAPTDSDSTLKLPSPQAATPNKGLGISQDEEPSPVRSALQTPSLATDDPEFPDLDETPRPSTVSDFLGSDEPTPRSYPKESD